MSELSYLEKLLDGAEVEWFPLDAVAKIKHGKDWKGLGEGTVPVYGSGGIMGYVDKYSYDKPTVLIPRKGTITNVFYVDTPFWNVDTIYYTDIEISKVLPKYFYHFIKTIDLMALDTGSGRPSLTQAILNRLLIPIPCPDNPEKSLAIQSEIVRILDKFTALTAELTAELTMRKKQYNYYRDQLLSFDEGEVEWKTLGAIGKFTYGYAAKAQISGDARFVRITDINTNGKLSPFEPMFVDISAENEKYTLKKNDLLMARTGATFGKTMIFEEDYPAIYAGFLIKLSLDRDIIDPKYYWHFAQSDYFWEQANKLVSGGGQPQFNANALKQIKVPIPYPNEAGKSLSEQARIVSVLDKFDILASSITEGLPREIELRQKQYEYYRDLLFSFPKPEIASH
ncbi:restriction endonuclease subunit S [Citrobacter amalonaticus]|uniref:restriction endonuclease subunit S n=1 Tax=Citrobacter amalonaticus TaxID=35703 RepID=UPI002933E499|nr:restriction endonuclease subunit S [Citrobacter amalonaticus]MDV2140651.1 restriction endonuclease subunit S [Citrobacter amalonaticus]MEB0588157.1 restriction endonuclease subunit S [Citrobacter amalonaticus]